jgi:hypothetical protein
MKLIPAGVEFRGDMGQAESFDPRVAEDGIRSSGASANWDEEIQGLPTTTFKSSAEPRSPE